MTALSYLDKKRSFLVCWLILILLLVLLPSTFTWAKSPGQDALDLGASLYKRENYTQALEAFKKATQADPALLKAWENLGWAHYKLGQNQEAIAIWETLLKIDPKQPALFNQIGMIHLDSKSWEKAVQQFKKSLRINPKQPDISFPLAAAYEALGQWKDAALLYDVVFRDTPDETQATLRLMTHYEKQNQTEKAIAFLKKRISVSKKTAPVLRPQIARLFAQQGDQAYKREDYPAAQAFYVDAIFWHPTQGQYHVNLGWALRKAGEIRLALEHWKIALPLSANPEVIHHYLAEAYFDLGNDEKARNHYQSAWAQGQDQGIILYRLGELAFRQNNPDKALAFLSSLLEKTDQEDLWAARLHTLFVQYDHVDEGLHFLKKRLETGRKPKGITQALIKIYSVQAREATQAEKTDEAITAYNEILLLEPENELALRDLGWIYWRKAAWNQTEQLWLAYRNFHPEHPAPYQLLTRLYLKTKHYSKAIQTSEEGLRLSPEQPDLQLTLAKARFWDQQYLKSKQEAKHLAQTYPDHLPIQSFWGEILIQYGDFKQAKIQWKKVLALGSNVPRARYYYVRALHETGEHTHSLLEAKRMLSLHGPQKDLILFLAQDATIQEDHKEALRWYRVLIQYFPEEPSYWLEVSKIYRKTEDFSQNITLMTEAQKHHPNNQDILLNLANAYRFDRHYEKAHPIYQGLLKTYPHHKDAFIGLYETLVSEKIFPEAIHLLEKRGSDFFNDYEMRLQRGQIQATMGQLQASQTDIKEIAFPKEESIYLPILLYHGLSENPRSTLLSVTRFDEQLTALKNQGYQSITVNELADMIDNKKPFPKKPILITFDDARLDAMKLGDPVLKNHQMKATMFVPTFKMVKNGPFFSDWPTIRFYEKTGRWEMQSHGHLAHDPIQIDADGQQGTFLTNKKWLAEKNRLETDEEYRIRLEQDYLQSRSILGKEGLNHKIIGYAFPFSDAGQGSLGNMPEAIRLNDVLLKRYYRFGFIQDQSGFNILKTGLNAPLTLRRNSVASDWSGEQLVQRLVRQHPQNLSRIRLGQSYFWSGEYAAAGEVFSELGRQAPLLEEDTQYYLAAIAYHQFQYPEARKHLQFVLNNETIPDKKTKQLMEKMAWKTQPQLQARAGFSPESGERLRHWQAMRFLYPLENNIHLWGEAGHTHFRERGFENLGVQELSVGAQWFAQKGLVLDSQFRQRQRERGSGSQNIWLGARYGTGLHTLRLNWSYEDIETLQAHEADLQAHHFRSSASFQLPPQWNGQLSFAYLDYDDHNTRTDFGLRIKHRLSRWPNWQMGARLAFRDTQFQSNRYYTPEGLYETEGTLHYRHSWNPRWEMEAESGLGWASDRIHGSRWISQGRILLKKTWADHFNTHLQASFSRSPGYSREMLEALLQYRF